MGCSVTAIKHPSLSKDSEVLVTRFETKGKNTNKWIVQEIIGDTIDKQEHAIGTADLTRIQLYKVEEITKSEYEEFAHISAMRIIPDQIKEKEAIESFRYVKDSVDQVKMPISKLMNRTRLSCIKWRKGGSQKAKISKVKETIDFIFSRGYKVQ